MLAFALVAIAPAAMSGSPPELPEWFKRGVNWATGPVVYSVGTTLMLVVLFIFRRFFVQPAVAWTILNLAVVLWACR